MDKHEDIMYKLGSIDGKLDGINFRLDKIELTAKEIEDMKLWRAKIKGSVAIIGAVAALVASFFIYIGKLIINKFI